MLPPKNGDVLSEGQGWQYVLGMGGGKIYQAFGECILFLQRTSSSIGDGLNSEGGVFFWGG